MRYLFSMPYRQPEGFARALSKLVPALPSIDYSWARRRILDLTPYKALRAYRGPVVIAIDASGVSVRKSGGWGARARKEGALRKDTLRGG